MIACVGFSKLSPAHTPLFVINDVVKRYQYAPNFHIVYPWLVILGFWSKKEYLNEHRVQDKAESVENWPTYYWSSCIKITSNGVRQRDQGRSSLYQTDRTDWLTERHKRNKDGITDPSDYVCALSVLVGNAFPYKLSLATKCTELPIHTRLLFQGHHHLLSH